MAPNLFTAIQVSDPQIRDELRKVLMSAVKKNYYSKNYIVPLEEAHITITVFESDVAFAREQFNVVCQQNKEKFRAARDVIRLQGCETFGDKVLFAKPDQETSKRLHIFKSVLEQEMIKDHLGNGKMIRNDCYATYNPHVTMLHIRYIFYIMQDVPKKL